MIDCKSLVAAQLSAYWGWMVEQGITPEIVANTRDPDIRIPPYLKRSDQLVLNVSSQATNRLSFSTDGVGFDARFGGKEYNIFVPYSALFGVRGREIPQVTLFPMIKLPTAESSAQRGRLSAGRRCRHSTGRRARRYRYSNGISH